MEENIDKSQESIYSNRTVFIAFRIAFIALLIILSYIILEPFFVVVIFGIIIAVGIYPLFRKLSNLLGNKEKLASILITLTMLMLIVIPSLIFLESTIASVQNAADRYSEGTLVLQPPPQKVADWPIIGGSIYKLWALGSTNLEAALEILKPQIVEYGPKIVRSVAGLGGAIILTFFSILIAGVLLLQTESSEKMLHKAFLLLWGEGGKDFTELAAKTISSVVQGVLGIAFIQALAAGIVMFLFGIPAAGLWALGVLILAIIQLPPTLVLLPVAIYGFSIMDPTQAIIFLILSVIISIADTFLKPLFLGRGVEVPMLVILLGAIGGMIAFGILGLFIGAVVLAVSYKVFKSLIDQKSSTATVEKL